MLGLLVSALGAAGMIQGSRLQARHEAGNGEATILDNLRGATNNAIFETMGLVQNGEAIAKNGTTSPRSPSRANWCGGRGSPIWSRWATCRRVGPATSRR